MHYWTCRPLSILSTTISSSKDSEPPSVRGSSAGMAGVIRSWSISIRPYWQPPIRVACHQHRSTAGIRPRTIVICTFTADVLQIVGGAGAGVQQYADDTQAYRHCKANEATEAVRRLQSTLSEIRDWMSSNRLKLNPSKTQWIWIGTRMQLAKIDRRELLERFPGIVFESSVVDLGVVIDQELKMDAHVGIMTRSCFYQLRQLRTIRQSLSDDATRMLIHSFVVTRVDYCNSVLSGITVVQTDRVQRILNAAARLLLRIPKFAPVAALIRDHLHWLPATQRIRFKILLLVSKCIHQRAPSYLQELCVPASTVVGRRNLRSADQYCLIVPRCRSSSMQRRGFSAAGPMAWNSLPAATRVQIAANSNISKQLIKTYLFDRDKKIRIIRN